MKPEQYRSFTDRGDKRPGKLGQDQLQANRRRITTMILVGTFNDPGGKGEEGGAERKIKRRGGEKEIKREGK